MPITERTATSLTLNEAVPFKSKLLLLSLVLVTCAAFLWALVTPYTTCAKYDNGSSLRPKAGIARCVEWRPSNILDRSLVIVFSFGVAAIFTVAGLPSLLARRRIVIINRETSTVTVQ